MGSNQWRSRAVKVRLPSDLNTSIRGREREGVVTEKLASCMRKLVYTTDTEKTRNTVTMCVAAARCTYQCNVKTVLSQSHFFIAAFRGQATYAPTLAPLCLLNTGFDVERCAVEQCLNTKK